MKRNKLIYDLTLTYLQKNRDYGNSVDKTRLKLGQEADLVRMADKIHRIEQLAIKENTPSVQESIEDTILDLIVYMAIHDSGYGFVDMKELTNSRRLIRLIQELDVILTDPKEVLQLLQKELGEELLPDTVVNYIANYITVITE